MKVLLVALVSILTLGACESSSGPQLGTNTNWMRACDNDAECGEEHACLCGRCTSPCSDLDDSCAEGAVCSPSDAARLQCAGDETSTCQPECTASEECQLGRLCHRGVCADPIKADSCPEGFLFCEDFDDEVFDYQKSVTDGNLLSRIDVASPSGDSALEVLIDNGPSTAYMKGPLPVQTSGELYLSGWVRVAEQEAHDVAPLALWTPEDEGWALRLVIKDAKLQLWSNTSPRTDSFQLLAGEWHCIQLQVHIADAPQGSVSLSLDGEVVATATEFDTLPEGGIQYVTMGSVWAGAPANFLLDRVVVSNSPIDCFE